MRQRLSGRVGDFDVRRGLGEIAVANGERYAFHAASIADGTRRIAIDEAVTFVVAAGPAGRWEATEIAEVIEDQS